MRQMARQMARYWHGVSKVPAKGTQGAPRRSQGARPGLADSSALMTEQDGAPDGKADGTGDD